jgi:hypothetical protein
LIIVKTLPENCRTDFLNFIQNDDPNNVKFPIEYSSGSITKTSYYHNTYDSKLVDLYFKHFFNVIVKQFGQNFSLKGIWYQIYRKKSNSFHGYHDHTEHDGKLINSHISAVYYAKLQDTKLVTKFLVDGKEFQPDAKEGDLVLFDSRIKHMSPPNDTEHHKMIVSFNLNFGRYIS